MPTKYTVVYVIPAEIRNILEEKYLWITGKEMPTRNLHISFAFSFFLKEGYGEVWLLQSIREIVFEPISAWLTAFAVFTQMETRILHIQVEPFELLGSLQKDVLSRIRDGVEVDLTAYNNRVVPEFRPHISLDYDFAGDEASLVRLRGERVSAFFEIDKLTVIRMRGEEWEEI